MASGTLSADGSTDWVELPEGVCSLLLGGTWGSGTAKLQVQQADGSTAQDGTSASWTADVVTKIDLGGGGKVRVNLSGATDPALKWEIHPVRARAEVGESTVMQRPLRERY